MIMADAKKPAFGGYTINFAGRTETAEKEKAL